MEEITREDILKFVKTLPVSAQIKGRFRACILDKFPTPKQFLVSSEAELKKLRNYGKGMTWVVAQVKEKFWQRKHDAEDRVLFDQRVRDTVNKLGAEYEKMREALNPVLTLAELQGIVSMMQLMNLDRVDLVRVRKFLDAVSVKEGEGRPI